MDECPEILLGQRTLPGGHGGAAHAGNDHAVEILELVIGPHRAKLGTREVWREELHPVLALRQLGPVHVLAELGIALPGELFRDLVDVALRRKRGMARQALGGPVVHGPSPFHGRRLLLPWVRRRSDGLAGLLVLPTIRERLQVLDGGEEVRLGDAVPGTHRGPVQAEADDAHEVVIIRQRAAGNGAELERPEGEVARRRPDAGRGGSLSVALVAVASPAVEDIGYLTVREHGGGDGLPAQLHRHLEPLRAVPLAAGGEGGRRSEDEEEGPA